MAAVVQADTDDLADACDWRAESLRHLDHRQRSGLQRGPSLIEAVAEEFGGDALGDGAKVAPTPIASADDRTFRTGQSVTGQAHRSTPLVLGRVGYRAASAEVGGCQAGPSGKQYLSREVAMISAPEPACSGTR